MNDFIKKLIDEKKINLVEPSLDISKSYDIKSSNSFKAAKILLSQDLLEESTSMAYYSMYHKLTSLFFLIGIKCENHSGSIILLKDIFDLDNKIIRFAKKERVDKQYYTDFKLKGEDIKEMIGNSQVFIDLIDIFKDKLTEQSKGEYRRRMLDYLKKSI